MYDGIMSEQEEKELKIIVDDYWEDFRKKYKKYGKKKESGFVVEPSFPIIWFGDMCKYLRSPKRIVTVAKNPSNSEFPNGTVSLRFPGAKDLDLDSMLERSLESTERKTLIDSYNMYFKNNPYPKFFKCFENLLQNLPEFDGLLQNNPKYAIASYGDKDNEPKNFYVSDKEGNAYTYRIPRCTAIHIDLRSALATDPVWSGLSEDERNNLIKEDLKEGDDNLFKRFLAFLKPDIILLTGNEEDRREFVSKDDELATGTGAKRVGAHYKGKLLVFGSFLNGKPFGGTDFYEEIGRQPIEVIFDKYASWKREQEKGKRHL